MHEFNLLRNLLKKIKIVSDEHGGARVVSVSIWLGALSHITPEHFEEHFNEETKGTIAEGAKLKIEQSDDMKHPNAQDILLREVEVEAEASA